MIETNWSPEFQHLVLAVALRVDRIKADARRRS